MKKNILTSLFMLSAMIPVYAEDLTLTDGKVLHDVEVLSAGVDTLKIRHKEGISSVFGNKLPSEWQQKYKMTSEDVQARMEAQQQKKEETVQLKKDSLTESGKKPRYLSAEDVQKIYTLTGELSTLEATATSLRWNYLEAKRTGNDELALAYMNDWNAIQPQLIAEINKKAQLSLIKEKQSIQEKEELLATLKETQQEIKNQGKRTNLLEDTLRDLKDTPRNVTTVVSAPDYTNINNVNTTIIRPRPLPAEPGSNIIIPRPPSHSGPESGIIVRPRPQGPTVVRPSVVRPATVIPAPRSGEIRRNNSGDRIVPR